LAAIRARVLASITFTSSVGATHAHRYQAAYDAAHAGIQALARAFAVELGDQGIVANAVAVGPVAESASTAADGHGALAEELVALVPAGRYARVAEVAAVLCAVGSERFAAVNGMVITVDGGLTVQLRPRRIERIPTSQPTMPPAPRP